MTFATRIDLIGRCNARRLAQLAVPTDMTMPPEAAMRVAIEGGDLTGYTVAEQESLAKALEAIDTALVDADALIQSYGIPSTLRTSLIARLCSTIAIYYLQGAERMTDDVQKAYDAADKTLRAHASGHLNLVPALPTDPEPEGDVISITSNSRRYYGGEAESWDLP